MNPRANVTLPADLHRRVVAFAKSWGRSISETIARLVRLGAEVADKRTAKNKEWRPR